MHRHNTCRIFEHHLSILDFQGDEVMFLIEASIIEEKTIVLQGGKTIQKQKKTMSIMYSAIKSYSFLVTSFFFNKKIKKEMKLNR